MYDIPPHTSAASRDSAPIPPDAVAGEAGADLPPESDAVTAVRFREACFRRSLVAADVVSTIAALFVAVVFLGDDQLRIATVAMVALVVGAAKITGLYDRDELVLRKSTIDELPRLFQLATLTTLVFWLLSAQLLRGTLGHHQALALWFALSVALAVSRAVARRAAGRLTSVERG